MTDSTQDLKTVAHPPSITLVVITRNEAKHIKRCLESVTCCQEKIVIDSNSTDNTRDIAQECGARVIEQAWLGFGRQRNFGASLASHDWVLCLDADEVLTPELNREILEVFKLKHPAKAFTLKRYAMYMGKPMRWYKPMLGEKLIRLYHRRHAEWSLDAVHEKVLCENAVYALTKPFEHHHSPTLVHKQMKVLQYAELDALTKLKKKAKPHISFLPFIYMHAFLRDYLWRQAIGDGLRGIIVAHIAASYACYKRLRLYEMQYNPESVHEAADALSTKLGWQNPDE